MASRKKMDPAIPNTFIRSGMFTIKSFRSIDRPYVSRTVFSNEPGRYYITYDGNELNQLDYQVYASLLKQQRMSGLPIGSLITIPVTNILSDLGITFTGPNYDNVWETMGRLKRGNVSILSGKMKHEGSLILEMDRDARRHINFVLSKKVTELFNDECTYVDIDAVVSLSSGMAKWLYSFYRSSAIDEPIELDKLRVLMCPPDRMETKEFNRVLREALTEVSKLGNGPFIGWSIKGDLVSVYKPGKKGEVVHRGLNDHPDPFAS